MSRGILLAAVAVLCASATTARAAAVTFQVDPAQSSLQFTSSLLIGKTNYPTVPVYPGSDTVSLSGTMKADVNPGSISLLSGSNVVVDPSTVPGVGGIPGNFAPFDPVSSDPVGPPPAGTTPNSSFNLATAAIGLTGVYYGITMDFDPTGALAVDGSGNFNLAGKQMLDTAGRVAFVSFLGNDTSSLSGSPTLFGTLSPDIGNISATTLTIPFHSTYTFQVTADFGGVFQTVTTTGVIVGHVVPEPSSVALLGMAMVGMAGCVWRARRRKA